MSQKLFISHSSEDKDLVKVLAKIIERVSANQISIWFSSDDARNGGFFADDTWYSTILDNLNNCSAVIAFITPNSNNQPWLLFESGYAEALDKTMFIPLKFLISVEEISSPIKQKQIFSFTDIKDANVFLNKVLGAFDITYDQEIYHDYIEKSISEMRKLFSLKSDKYNSSKDISVQNLENLEIKIDQLTNQLIHHIYRSEIKKPTQYEICIKFPVENKMMVEYISISPSTTVSEVLDKVYFFLDGKVKAFTYLESWVLQEEKTGQHMVISEIQHLVPAYTVFGAGTTWQVKFLEDHYYSSREVKQKFYKND